MPSSSNAPFPAIIADNKGSSGTLTNLKIGKSTSTTTNDFGGDLGELLIFTRQLTSTEEQKVQGYLAHKWGGTAGLDANHPYKNVAPIFDNKPLINLYDTVVPDDFSGLQLWLDTSDLTSAGATWADKSGTGTDATKNGTATLVSNVQNGIGVMRYSGTGYHEWTDINNIRTVFWVVRAASGNEGFILADDNQYHFHDGEANFWHGSHTSANVRNGNLSVNGTRNLNGTTTSMVSKLANMAIVSLKTTGNVEASRFSKDRNDNSRRWSGDLGELLIYTSALTDDQIEDIEGYLALKWGLVDSLAHGHEHRVQNVITSPVFTTTGKPANIQIPADRNPTTWSASGLPSGLSINNSGIISGSPTVIGEYNATLTAVNADGNDSKVLKFIVSKGNRVITWDQTFAGVTYGDNSVSLTATATGTGDLNYTSSDNDIIEINGTSAIIRGGGSVTLTATAAENSTAFAAVPVSHTFSIAKAPLTITGQDLSLSVGDAIPDLNYTVSGWKNNDASLAIAANPAGLGLKLWLDASDSSSITQSSGAVSQLSDKSGNGNHVVQSTTDNKPQTGITDLNGLNTLSFDGSDYLRADSSNIKNEDQTWVLIASVDAQGSVNNSGDSLIAYGGWVNGSWELRGHDNYRFFGKVAKDSTAISTSNSSSSDLRGTTQMFSITFDRTNSKLSAWRNGTNFDNAVTDSRNLLVDSRITVMANRSGTPQPIMGTFAEVVCYTSANTTDRQAVEGYLAHKWGLTGSLPSNHTHKIVSLTRGPSVTTDATNSSSAGTYYVRPSDAQSRKYSFTYVDGSLVLSSLTEQSIAWGQNFSSAGVGQTVDLNATASSALAVLYSVSDTSVAELAVTNQSSLQTWYKLDETSGDASDSSANSNTGSLRNAPSMKPVNLVTPSLWTEPMTMCVPLATPGSMVPLAVRLPCGLRPPRQTNHSCNTEHPALVLCSSCPQLCWSRSA
jgi:hypothetical protein